jgi:integrase
MEIEITPKEKTEHTWLWEIKDTDSRILPLTEDVIKLLIDLRDRRPEGYPYVFVPPKRYDRIQLTRNGKSRRKKNTWSLRDANNSVINNFSDMFNEIKTRAGIKKGTFHDLRRTAITSWFYAGLEITEVMRLAGHSKYETCLQYYLSVSDDLVDRAREAVRHSVSREMLERGVRE